MPRLRLRAISRAEFRRFWPVGDRSGETGLQRCANVRLVDIPLRDKSLECEGKLVVVIGKGGRYITVEHALKHIFGFSIYNDSFVKGHGSHSSQFGISKMFDLSAAFGPVVVTEDEFGDPYEQTIETRIDGELER